MKRSNRYEKNAHLDLLKNRTVPPNYQRLLLDHENIERKWCNQTNDPMEANQLMKEITRFVNNR